MKNLKDILIEQWAPAPGSTPVEPSDGGASSGDGNVIDRVRDNVTGGDNNNSNDNSNGDGGVLGLVGALGGSPVSSVTGEKWEFNKNPTGQMKTDKEEVEKLVQQKNPRIEDQIYVRKLDNGTESLVLAGKLIPKTNNDKGEPALYPIEKNDNGEWGWLDLENNNKWYDFSKY